MSFLRRIGDDSSSNQKLVMMKKKYFRNILDFNQAWQHQKKEDEVKQKQESHRKFNKVVGEELEAIEMQKERMWRQKMSHQNVLKSDYEQQMVEKVVKSRMERQGDLQFRKMQDAENDRFMQRRMLDFMKIYDRKSIRESRNGHRRTKTQAEEHFNPEVKSYHEDNRRKSFRDIPVDYKTNQLKVSNQKGEDFIDPSPSTQIVKNERGNSFGELRRMKRQFEDRRQHNISILPSLGNQRISHQPMNRPDSKGRKDSKSVKILPQNNGILG